MEFSLKIQHIGENLLNNPDYIVLTHQFDVSDQALIQKRGTLFVCLNINVDGDFDLTEVSSLFIDSIQEYYYKLSDETPLHAIETSLKRATQVISSINSKDGKTTLGSQNSNLSISYATALIWNQILYTTYAGSPAVYLIRGTGARDLAQNKSSDELWTNSSILEADDVVIIGTPEFAKSFPQQEITNSLGSLNNAVLTDPNKHKLAAILIKTSIANAKQTTSASEKFKDVNIKDTFSNVMWKVKNKVEKNHALSDKFKFYQSKKTAPVSSISGLTSFGTIETVTSSKSKSRPKRIVDKKRLSRNGKQIAVGMLMLAGLVFANYKMFYSKSAETPINTNDQYVYNLSKTGEVKGTQTNELENMHKELISYSSISKKLFPISISTYRGNFVVMDYSENTFYQIDLKTKLVKTITKDLSDVKFLKCSVFISSNKDLCFIYTSDRRFLVISPLEGDTNKIDSYSANVQDVVDIGINSLSSTLYMLTSSNIHTFKLRDTESRVWLKDDDLSNAKSIAVDENIVYVLASNDIFKYSNGTKTSNFKIDKSKLKSPIQIQTSSDGLYVLDENKVVIYNKTNGEFIKETALADENDPETPTMFTLTKETPTQIIFGKSEKFFITNE